MGVRLAQAIRGAASSELGLRISIGVAPNKLLAKLSSRKAKPDGVHVLESSAAVEALLQATPAARLPGGRYRTVEVTRVWVAVMRMGEGGVAAAP